MLCTNFGILPTVPPPLQESLNTATSAFYPATPVLEVGPGTTQLESDANGDEICKLTPHAEKGILDQWHMLL